MMETIQPKVVSRLILKPSTPNHPEIHKLSFFDECASSVYGPLVYFYTHEAGHGVDNIAHKSTLLRSSLSRLISQYYPLAGKMRADQLSFDCNDQGIAFLEARIQLKLSEFLDNPREELLQLLFPDGLHFKDANLRPPVVVQLTFFECGGMAIAVCITHKLMDMASMCSFVYNWATMTRDSGREISLDFNLGAVYPPLNLPPNQPSFSVQETICRTRRIVFSKSKIAKLKSLVAQVESPTRVELVTALIYKTALSAQRASSETPKKMVLSLAINLRKRLSPTLTEKNVGNFVGFYFVASTEQDDNSKLVDLKWLVRELRQAKVEFLANSNKASAGEELCWMYLDHYKKNVDPSKPMNSNMYMFSSWCRFPYYEADFGWGKPAWVTSTGYISNMIMLMDTRDGDGIEAIVTLEEPQMALFERDQELLAFGSFNPSRLDKNHGAQRGSKL